MDTFFKILSKISDRISNRLMNICIPSFIIWPIIMTLYLSLRSVGIVWLFVEEFTEYWLVLIISFSLAYTLKTKSHIVVDLVTRRLPERIRRILEIFVMFLSLLTIIYLFNSSLNFLIYGIEKGTTSSNPSHMLLWPVYLLFPLGFFSFSLEMFIEIYYKLKELSTLRKIKIKIEK